MTWAPLWNTANKVLIAPVVIPTLSYGLYYFITLPREAPTLSDPSHKNYNPFTFNQK